MASAFGSHSYLEVELESVSITMVATVSPLIVHCSMPLDFNCVPMTYLSLLMFHMGIRPMLNTAIVADWQYQMPHQGGITFVSCISD